MAKRKREAAGKEKGNKKNTREKDQTKLSKMEAYEELLIWAKDKGIVLNGVEPRRIPGRGMGIVATKPLKVTRFHRVKHWLNPTNMIIRTTRPS